MVFTPRRRRLFRAILVGLIFTAAVLLLQHWNLVARFSGVHSISSSNTARYGRSTLDVINYEQKLRRQDVNATNVLKVDKSKQDIALDAKKKPNITWIKHPWKSSLRGFLNVHVWLDWCGSTVNDLRRNIHFPKYPDVRLKTNIFHLTHDSHNFGQRVFGFVHPPRTGRYTFAISSDDSSELWLSSDDDPNNARLIAWVGNLSDPFWQGIVGDGQFTKYKTQISEEIFLRRNKRYFVEALHKQSSSNDHLLVAWKMPHIGNFTYITRGRISQYIHPHELHNLDVTRYARHIPLTPAVLQESITPHKLKNQIDIEREFQTSTFHYARHEQAIENTPTTNNVKDLLSDNRFPRGVGHLMYPSCDYKPSYRVDFKVARYEGVYLIHETAVYPNDKTHLKHVEYYNPCYEMRSRDSHGQLLRQADQNDFAGDEFSPVGWQRRREDGNFEFNNEEQKNNIGQLDDTAGNISIVNYTDYRRVRENEGTFKKRKILAILASNNITRDSRLMDLSHNRKAALTSYDKNFQRNIYDNREIKKSENIVSTQLVKTAKSLDSNIKTSLESRAKKVEDISNVRANSAQTISSKQTHNEEHKQRDNNNNVSIHKRKELLNQTRDSLRKSVDAVNRIRVDPTVIKRGTLDKTTTENIKNSHIKQDVKHRDQQVVRQNIPVKDNDTLSERRDLPMKGIYVAHSKRIETRDSLNQKIERRESERLNEKTKQSVDEQSSREDKGSNASTPQIEIWENVKESRDTMKNDNSVEKNRFSKVWHRKRKKRRTASHVFVDEMSVLAPTLRKLKESGQWKEIKAYAKKNNLLLTNKTWMYVTWKFLRYEKPKKPHDKLVAFVYKQNPSKCRTDGNILLNEEVAKSIVNKYMKDVQKRYGRNVYLRRVINVEENHDVLNGDRYLIELELGLNNKNETFNVSDYVYLPLAGTSFCFPPDFIWKRNVTVHVIVPVKDQGKWVQHFINDMSELYETTQDPNVNVIIVDFNSTDIDIEQALIRSPLKRYRFLQINGSFQRALGIQIGAEAVENPDDIIFTCDLHLDIPNNMIDILRKHCIQGKMAFSPLVIRLQCGFTPALPYGEWETMGYGLFAIYKSDFDRIGGMNVDEFKTKWGGEDWEMVDRCLQKGMEIERLRVPNFYHYYHSKQGMWGSYGFEDSVSGNTGDNMVEDQLVPVYDAYSDRVMGYSYNQPLMPAY